MQLPDARQSAMVVANKRTLEQRTLTLADHHDFVAQYRLCPAVPKDVRIQWDTARNLWLYAWYVWRFFAVAEMQAYTTLELALKMRLDKERGNLGPLMKEAIANGLLVDREIVHHQEQRQHELNMVVGKRSLFANWSDQ